MWEAHHLNQKHKQRNGGWCIVVLLKLAVTKVVVSLSVHDGTPGCFLLPVGIGKCILVVGDTVGAMMHAPTACVQGCSRSRGEVVSG